MALMEYYCMPADFKVQILEEEELYDDHAPLWDDLSEMLGGEVISRVARVRCTLAWTRREPPPFPPPPPEHAWDIFFRER